MTNEVIVINAVTYGPVEATTGVDVEDVIEPPIPVEVLAIGGLVGLLALVAFASRDYIKLG